MRGRFIHTLCMATLTGVFGLMHRSTELQRQALCSPIAGLQDDSLKSPGASGLSIMRFSLPITDSLFLLPSSYSACKELPRTLIGATNGGTVKSSANRMDVLAWPM